MTVPDSFVRGTKSLKNGNLSWLAAPSGALTTGLLDLACLLPLHALPYSILGAGEGGGSSEQHDDSVIVKHHARGLRMGEPQERGGPPQFKSAARWPLASKQT